MISNKVLSYSDAIEFCHGNPRVVITSGCFDILHAGHVRFLEECRNMGGALLVGVNTDQAVTKLKGPQRPINHLESRMLVLAGLESVSRVCPIDDTTVARFILDMAAGTWVKGGDYTMDTLNKSEVEACAKARTEIVLKPLSPGLSTTAIIAKINNAT